MAGETSPVFTGRVPRPCFFAMRAWFASTKNALQRWLHAGVRTMSGNAIFGGDCLIDGANVIGLFVWVPNLKGGFRCERWAADLPLTKRPEPLTAYVLNKEQMTWPLNGLASLFPPDMSIVPCLLPKTSFVRCEFLLFSGVRDIQIRIQKCTGGSASV